MLKINLRLLTLLALPVIQPANAADSLCSSINTTQGSQFSFSDFLPTQKDFAGRKRWHSFGDSNDTLVGPPLAQWQKQKAAIIQGKMVEACEKASLAPANNLLKLPISNAVNLSCQKNCKDVFTEYGNDAPAMCLSVCSDYRTNLSALEALKPQTLKIVEPAAAKPKDVSLAHCPEPDENPLPEVVTKLAPKVLGMTPLTHVREGRITFSTPLTINFESGKDEVLFPGSTQCGVYNNSKLTGEQTFSKGESFLVLQANAVKKKDRVELILKEYKDDHVSEYSYGFFCHNNKDGTPPTLDDFNQTKLLGLAPNLLLIDQ